MKRFQQVAAALVCAPPLLPALPAVALLCSMPLSGIVGTLNGIAW